MKNEKDNGSGTKFFLIFAALYTIIILLMSKYIKYQYDILIIAIILIITIGLVLISFKTKYKLLLRLISLYIFFNFIFFPFCYLKILKNNINSFQIDTSISNFEKTNSLNEVENYYDASNNSTKLKYLKSIITNQNNILEKSMRYINSGNTVVLDSFIFSKNSYRNKYSKRPECKPTLNICSKNGLLLTQLDDNGANCNLGNDSQTIRNYLELSLIKINKQIQNFNIEKNNILEKNDIWTYRQILPYTLNMFTTSNMVAKSKIANICLFLHQFLVVFLILGSLSNFFYTYLTSKRDS